ncbi:MAG: hypothetical protein CMO55_26055 [Verrucomicrobiales bacterium]|nr:hypothetical protein [Verrucomicrobiales bacterium]
MKFLTLFVFLTSALCSQAWPQEVSDRVFVDGNVVTVDENFSVAEAFVVRNGRFALVGTEEEATEFAAEGAEKVDLQGATVIPGLIDTHVHSTSAAMYEFENRVPSFETVKDVLAYIKQRADAAEEGDWITMSQVFITRLEERRFPTREEMDRVAPKNPVLFRTGPDAAVNSLALELSGIDKDYQPPEGSSTRVERDPETGEPTGIIRSHGGVVKVTPSRKSIGADFEDRVEGMKKLLADYNRVGLTGLADRNVSDSSIRIYQTLKDRGELTCRSYLYHGLSNRGELEDLKKKIDKIATHPLREKDDMLWVRGIKIFLDGGMLTGSAYMKEPWGLSESYGIVDPEYRGVRYVEPDKLYEMAKYALSKDMQFTAHAVGDAGVETLVNAYSRIAENDFPIRDHRPCVTHCNFMSLDAIDKMAKYGIVADLQPAWLWLDGSTLTHHFGDERLTWFQPYKTLFEKGVVVGGGSDHMQKLGGVRSVNPYNPFLGMWIALTRQPKRMDGPLHPEQKITREEVLRLYTINNAFITFSEADRGSIEPGKLADFVILDRDILECPVEDVKDIRVKQTWLGGKTVFDRETPWTISSWSDKGAFTSGIEGPACDKEGNLYVVNFGEQGTIGKISPQGEAELWVKLPEGSTGNGIRFDADGQMYVADYTGHNILKIDPATKEIIVFAHEPKMHQPNDLAIGPDGTLYASDPDWKNGDGALWRISSSGEVTLLADGKGTTNGIEVSPDGKKLYVAESKQRRILSYDLSEDGISNEEILIEFEDHLLDGMRCDIDGNLYVTRHGAAKVLKLSPTGEILRTIELPGGMPSNLCFGGPDGKTLYITEVENREVLRIRVDKPGWSVSMFQAE